MKQGRADVSNVADTKREPISHAVDEGAVANIGIQTGNPTQQLYEGRGFKAPMNSVATHKGGSQGRH